MRIKFEKMLSFLSIFLPASRHRILFEELEGFLDRANADADLSDRLYWLEDLAAWIHGRTSWNPLDPSHRNSAQERFRSFLRVTASNPERKTRIAKTFQSVLRDISLVPLFTSAGLAQGSHLFGEIISRSQKKFFPSLTDLKNGSSVLLRLFRSEDEAGLLMSLETKDWDEFISLLELNNTSTPQSRRLRQAMIDAVLILAAEIRAIGLSGDVSTRAGELDPKTSPAYLLGQACDRLTLSIDAIDSCHRELAKCRGMIKLAFEHFEEYGVNVELVYRLERMNQALSRIELLLQFLSPAPLLNSKLSPLDMTFVLANESLNHRKITRVVHDNLQLLSRKIVERTGANGEHYITRDMPEYLAMLRGAAGGGVVTLGTTLAKFGIKALSLPIFFDFLTSAFNYVGSFLLMQALGFKLATKQPSMTAAALAAKLDTNNGLLEGLRVPYLEKSRRSPEERAFTEEVIQTFRSQFAAALGNLGAVIPAAILVDTSYWWLKGAHLLPTEEAQAVIRSLHPALSMTIPFAILTGVLLWLASICAGWLENWVVYNRVPEILARSRRLSRAFGAATAQRWSRGFLNGISGFGGNVSLGLMLAAVPALGRIFGVALDVRHVTLSTGALTLALCALDWPEGLPVGAGAAMTGILLIGLLNFGVSFLLAIRVALQARDVDLRRATRLFLSVGRVFLREPWKFFVPTRNLQP